MRPVVVGRARDVRLPRRAGAFELHRPRQLAVPLVVPVRRAQPAREVAVLALVDVRAFGVVVGRRRHLAERVRGADQPVQLVVGVLRRVAVGVGDGQCGCRPCRRRTARGTAGRGFGQDLLLDAVEAVEHEAGPEAREVRLGGLVPHQVVLEGRDLAQRAFGADTGLDLGLRQPVEIVVRVLLRRTPRRSVSRVLFPLPSYSVAVVRVVEPKRVCVATGRFRPSSVISVRAPLALVTACVSPADEVLRLRLPRRPRPRAPLARRDPPVEHRPVDAVVRDPVIAAPDVGLTHEPRPRVVVLLRARSPAGRWSSRGSRSCRGRSAWSRCRAGRWSRSGGRGCRTRTA